MRDMLENVRNMIYPLRLKPHVAELIGLKLHDLWQAHRNAQDALDKERNRAELGDYVAIGDLDNLDQQLVREFLVVDKRHAQLRALFSAKFSHATEDGKIYRKVSDMEVQRRRDDVSRRQKELSDSYKAMCEQLRDVARELANANVAEVRSKVPPAILAKLDGIGAKELSA